MSRQPPTVTSASTSLAGPWAFTRVHRPLDGTLSWKWNPLRGEPNRPARQTRGRRSPNEAALLSARDRPVLDRFLTRGKHP